MLTVTYGNGGWVRVDEPGGLPGPLYMRLSREGGTGPWRTQDFYLVGGQRSVTAGDLRRLPLSQIEAFVVAEGGDKRLEQTEAIPGPELRVLASHFGTTFGSQVQHWVADSLRAQIPDSGVPRVSEEEPPKLPAPEVVAPLRAPENGLTEDFLRHVAAAYRDAVRNGKRPAVELARQSAAPLRTVQRWIYTARKRGIMPPGTPGRVG